MYTSPDNFYGPYRYHLNPYRFEQLQCGLVVYLILLYVIILNGFGGSNFGNGGIAIEAKIQNCTLLIKIPHWLVAKHTEYVNFINKEFNITDMLEDLFQTEYAENEGDVDADPNANTTTNEFLSDDKYWTEVFSTDPQSNSKYFHELMRHKTKAMYIPKTGDFYDNEDDVFISAMDKQFVTKNISYPEDYGIETECEVDDDVQIAKVNLWPNARIPIVLNMTSKNLPPPYIESQIKNVKRIIAVLEYMTCIRFVPVDWEHRPEHFVEITNQGIGCWSHVGKIPILRYPNASVTNHLNYTITYQKYNLGMGCNNQGVILHEFMHTLGIHHEHQRYDRDIYLRVNLDNINPVDMKSFTKKFSINTPKTPYRYDSIMHYPSYFLAKDKARGSMIRLTDESMISFNSTQAIATITDFNRINYMYGCLADDTRSEIGNYEQLQFQPQP